MAGGKEVRDQIGGIQNTQKITSAMQMVAASKMRKAQERMELGKPYAKNIRSVVSHIARSTPEYKHEFMNEREVKRVGYIIVSSDRGLCGGLNINLFKSMVKAMKANNDENIEIDICTIGSKGASFFSSFGGNVVAVVKGIGETPSASDVVGAVKVMLDNFSEGTIDKLYLVSNEFINTMIQQPTISQLLPLEGAEDEEFKHHWDYIYEPDAKDLLNGLLTRYIESQVYQAIVENNACEQAARMIAMKSASDNAGDLIDELQLIYNKARQAAITQELSEIVSGASAV